MLSDISVGELSTQLAGVVRVIVGVTSTITIGAGSLVAWYKWSKPFRDRVEQWAATPQRLQTMEGRQENIEKKVTTIEKEYLTNSGSTLKDKVNAIDTRTRNMNVMIGAIIEADRDLTVFTNEKGEITRVSMGYSTLTGLTAITASKGGWRDSIHPDDLPTVEELWERSLRTKEKFVHEFRVRHVDPRIGGSIAVKCIATPMVDNEAMKPGEEPRVTGWASRFELKIDPLTHKPNANLMPMTYADASIKEH